MVGNPIPVLPVYVKSWPGLVSPTDPPVVFSVTIPGADETAQTREAERITQQPDF